MRRYTGSAPPTEEDIAVAPPERFLHMHKWRLGDLVFWDNRCLPHRAIANFEMGKHRRVRMRVVVKGEAP